MPEIFRGHRPEGSFFRRVRKTDVSIQSETRLESTSAQRATARVNFYTTLVDILREGAERYTSQRVAKRPLSRAYKNERVRVEGALEEFYSAQEAHTSQNDQTVLQEFGRKWRDEAQVFEELFHQLSPKIQVAKEEMDRADLLTPQDRRRIALHTAKKLAGLSKEQRRRVFELAGYPGVEIPAIVAKLGISGGFSLGLGWAYEGLGAAAGVRGAMNPFLEGFPDTNAVLVVLTSYGAYYSSLVLNAHQNLRLLRNERINTSPNFVATCAYFLLKKFVPQNERVQTVGTWIGSLSLDTLKEIGWAGTMLIPGVGPSIITSANLVGAGVNSLQAVASEAVLRLYSNKQQIENTTKTVGQ